jgi:DUF2075 family protein
MRLYAGMSSDFIQEAAHNQIAGMLARSFFHYFRYNPPPAEVNSWRNSLRAISQVLQEGSLLDHGVFLEYQLPLSSKRLDCLVCGKGTDGRDRAVIVELKQWDGCSEADGEDLVSTWVGGGQREVLHPSAQVRQYQWYLQDSHTAFHEGDAPVGVKSCSYLHNYLPADCDFLYSSRFEKMLREFPAFSADQVPALTSYLKHSLEAGDGLRVLARIEESRYRPSKKLMDHVGNVVKGKHEYVLLDEQLVAYEKVFACAQEGFGDRRKSVIIIRGGPGTGKSVIAINLIADLLLSGRNAQYATGSRAFTETLRKIVGVRGSIQFKYFNGYAEAQASEIDVLICDEAHRIRKTSNNRYTAKEKRTGKSQIQEILDAARVAVFFIDDRQIVRPDEIGSSVLIRENAEASGCRVFEYQLEAQFRCAGSDGFVNWINNTLEVERTANVIWEGDDNFEFRIVDSPEKLEDAIRQKAATGSTARLMAGFCWPWSEPRPDGTLVDDVEIGTYRRPWNAKPDAKRLAKGIPRAVHWAYDPKGIKQIGCVYTAQGFEFDFVGVIFGPDLRYSLDGQEWVGHPESSRDRSVKGGKAQFLDLVKNTYRVLLSRALKGCYVYFVDKETEQFFRTRVALDRALERTPSVKRISQRLAATSLESLRGTFPFRRLPRDEVAPFENCVPIYDLKVAAGRFGAGQPSGALGQEEERQNPDEFEWAELPEEFRPRLGLFLAQVVGESMNRRIPTCSWCLFRLSPVGTREGKVVLVQLRGLDDPETGGQYTVKVYHSEKRVGPDGRWRHSQIVLRPDTDKTEFEPLVLDPHQSEDLRVVAELVAVLG